MDDQNVFVCTLLSNKRLFNLIVYPQLERGDYLPFTSKCDCLRCNKESPATVHFIKQNWRKEYGYDFKVMIAT